MKVQHEKLSVWFMEAQRLVVQHWDEVATAKDVIQLDPDYHKFLAMEEAGALEAFTARDVEGALIGYLLFLVNPSLHYKRDRFALADVIFISPAYRTPRAALRLISFAEEYLTHTVGVSKIHYHMKADHTQGHALLEHLGYRHVEDLFEKVVKRSPEAA